MAKHNQRSDPVQGGDGSSGPGSRSGVGKQGQGGASSRNEQDRSGSAQQEQGGSASPQDGTRGRDQDEERIADDIQSGSSPRSRSDSPDEGKGAKS